MDRKLKILGIAGSLREKSYNRATLREAVKLAPQDAEIEVFELNDIPAFNQDEERRPPEVIIEFKRKIREADAILFVTPEYNYSISGVLKNAIDWASRPHGDNAFHGKPAAIMGASIGSIATARAQYHLRQMFVFLNIHAVNQPEVMIGNAAGKFDEEGVLKDEKTKEIMGKLLNELTNWTKQLIEGRSAKGKTSG